MLISRAWATCDVTQIYLLRVISNVTDKKNELWKTIKLTSFQKPQSEEGAPF